MFKRERDGQTGASQPCWTHPADNNVKSFEGDRGFNTILHSPSPVDCVHWAHDCFEALYNCPTDCCADMFGVVRPRGQHVARQLAGQDKSVESG